MKVSPCGHGCWCHWYCCSGSFSPFIHVPKLFKSTLMRSVCFLRFAVGLLISTLPIHFPRSSSDPHGGELRTQKLKSHLVRTQSLNVLPLKPRVGQYLAIPATLTARDFFFYFYPSGPFTCIFSKTSHDFFPMLAVANTGSCVGPQNKIGHPARCRFPCWVPAEYK